MNIIELAEEFGAELHPQGDGYNPIIFDIASELQAFATEVAKQAIEEYKASLVPVAYHIGNEDGTYSRIGATYNNESTAKNHISSYKSELVACVVPLYALGETK